MNKSYPHPTGRKRGKSTFVFDEMGMLPASWHTISPRNSLRADLAIETKLEASFTLNA
jgi:hypothetical protein